MPTICPKCGSISDVNPRRTFSCPQCAFTIPGKDYEKLINFGGNVVRYGIHYRRKYERDLERDGALNSRYSLGEPSVVLSFIGGAIAGGIIGNAAYDGVKICFRGLAAALKTRSINGRGTSAKKSFASQHDLDLLYQLLGDDDEYAKKFVADIKDYLDGMPTADPRVKAVIIQEEMIHRAIDDASESLSKLFAEDMSSYVRVTASGTCYHRNDCPRLRSASKSITLQDAIRLYRPCSVCDPQCAEPDDATERRSQAI